MWWPWPLNLIYSHCLIRLNISSENNDWLQQYAKIYFSKNFPFKCTRKQIWPWRQVGQGQPRITIWTNLVGPTSPMLHTKSQYHRPSCSGEDFKMFFFSNIWAWRPSWSCDQNILHKFWLLYHKRSSHEIWVQLYQWFVRTLFLNILMELQYEWPKLKGQPWPLELIYSHCLIRLNISSENKD